MITSEQFAELKRMPDENSRIDYRRVFSEGEYEKLKLGLTANSMDEKWNGYFFEDSFYMCRSWTGMCIFDFGLRKIDDGYVVENARVNRNSAQYSATDNEYDVRLLDFLVSNLILGESKPFPNRSGADLPKGVEQHSTAGTGYPEISVGMKPWGKLW
ncbi:hypothetical protein [Ectopseudomonas alcaliphila]|uniref:hypothetical protein n=1 Tax=Ectopseudomonas alcaliphila TaxID=101564 RepID=UPI0027846E24|nr:MULTISPECIES: hypothetical protein [Pseudomonas]MDP9942089.1 hypothetical protein [Pseudomonas sp. 3400]MDR7014490.1 hypothetical protein [Pseudomonas alcaliphila]